LVVSAPTERKREGREGGKRRRRKVEEVEEEVGDASLIRRNI